MNELKEFDDSCDGSGYENGYGYGEENWDRGENGRWDGSGVGDGYGSGSGSDAGYGFGDGDGDEDGSGDGSGNGDGYGSWDSRGDG